MVWTKMSLLICTLWTPRYSAVDSVPSGWKSELGANYPMVECIEICWHWGSIHQAESGNQGLTLGVRPHMNIGGMGAKHTETGLWERFFSASCRNSDAKVRKPNTGLNFLAKGPGWFILRQRWKFKIPFTYFKLLSKILVCNSKTRRLSRSFY